MLMVWLATLTHDLQTAPFFPAPVYQQPMFQPQPMMMFAQQQHPFYQFGPSGNPTMIHAPPTPVPYALAQEHEAAAFLETLSRMAGVAGRGKYTCEVSSVLDAVHACVNHRICNAIRALLIYLRRSAPSRSAAARI